VKVASVLIAATLMMSLSCLAQESGVGREKQMLDATRLPDLKPDQVVVKIKKLRFSVKESIARAGVTVVWSGGTGYCLGPQNCEFILTNYHVAEGLGAPVKINGVKVLQTFEATSPQDKDAAWVKSALGFSLKFVPVRDVAIFRMQRALKGMHQIDFSPRKLKQGDEVRIYGHTGGGPLRMAGAEYFAEANDGMLYFRVNSEDRKILAAGSSGSLVVDESNQAVGLMQGFANGNLAAVIPVWSIAAFVKHVLPNEYSKIFSGFRADEPYRPSDETLVPVDLVAESAALAKNGGPEAGASPSPVLPEDYLWYDLDKAGQVLPARTDSHYSLVRAVEPRNVQRLRANAEDLLDNAKDLTAIGTERSFGGHSPEVSAQYLLRMVAGHQAFIQDGRESNKLPCPRETGMEVGTEWSDLPQLIGNNLRLTIEQIDDLPLPGWGIVKVFRYGGTAEDKVREIQYCNDYGFGIHSRASIAVAVRGEVWTDDALHILRITEELEGPPSKGWLNMRLSQLYGWLELPGGHRVLVPTNLMVRAEFTRDRQVYSTLCRVTNYRQFVVRSVVANRSVQPIF
jgi:hypothetical protein